MPYVVPPMSDEPPPDFVAFVAVRLAGAQEEAVRLTGGAPYAEEVYPLALSDVAIHWRRLKFLCRVERRDAAAEFLARRLARHAEQWRDEHLSTVEMVVEQPGRAPREPVRRASVAQLKAALIPETVRMQFRPVAEAAIAWEHAYRRHRLHVLVRVSAAVVLLFLFLTRTLDNLTP